MTKIHDKNGQVTEQRDGLAYSALRAPPKNPVCTTEVLVEGTSWLIHPTYLQQGQGG